MTMIDREQPPGVRVGEAGAVTPEQARRLVRFAWGCVRGTPLPGGRTPLALLRGRGAL